MVDKWIQKAFKNAGKGLLHKQLGVPVTEKIPVTFLKAIENTPVGGTAHNPTFTGHKKITVTLLLKRRVTALLNAERRK